MPLSGALEVGGERVEDGLADGGRGRVLLGADGRNEGRCHVVRRRLQPHAAQGHREHSLPDLEVCQACPQEVGEHLHGEVVEFLQDLPVANGGGGP